MAVSATIQELDFLLELASDGIKSHVDFEALANNMSEWFLTPVGSVASFPSWGNTLNKFRFYPQSSALAVMVESEIVRKMPVDVYGLVIRAISVVFLEIDLCNVRINCGIGTFEEVVRL